MHNYDNYGNSFLINVLQQMQNYDNYGNSFLINVLQQMQNYDNYGNSFLINSLQAIIMIITAIRFFILLLPNNLFRAAVGEFYEINAACGCGQALAVDTVVAGDGS